MDKWVTTQEAARLKVGLTQHRIAELARQGKIEADRPGGKKWRVKVILNNGKYDLAYTQRINVELEDSVESEPNSATKAELEESSRKEISNSVQGQETTFERTSDRQSEILSKLVKCLYDIQDISKNMTSSFGRGEKKEDYIEPFQRAVKLARDEFVGGRVFLPVDFVQEVEVIFKKIVDMEIDFETFIDPNTPDGEQRAGYWKKAGIIAHQEIPKLLTTIEDQARRIIAEKGTSLSYKESEASSNATSKAEIRHETDSPHEDILTGAQRRHLEKVRDQISEFSNNFKEIDLKQSSYYRDFPSINEEVRCHLPGAPFWKQVELFKDKDDVAETVYAELFLEIRTKGELEIGTLSNPYSEGEHITQEFIISIIQSGLEIFLGQPANDRYEWVPSVSKQTYRGNFISVNIRSEAQHRVLVQAYAKDQRCERLAKYIKELRLLRQDILRRIEGCVENEEYIHYFCSHCPQSMSPDPLIKKTAELYLDVTVRDCSLKIPLEDTARLGYLSVEVKVDLLGQAPCVSRWTRLVFG